MLAEWYARRMYAWETALTTRDENRIVRPLEWGFDWLAGSGVGTEILGGRDLGGMDTHVSEARHGTPGVVAGERERVASPFPTSPRKARVGDGAPDSVVMERSRAPGVVAADDDSEERLAAWNQEVIRRSDEFFGYETPTDFRLEERHPELFPTNVRPETLAQAAKWKADALAGKISKAQYLRFTSPERTPYPENDQVNARWYPAKRSYDDEVTGKPKQAIIVMPQWNADAFSHNALCQLFNRFGVSALRLSKPYHDIRRPAELERSDYAVSANLGRTISACRQAVVDIRSCIDWLETEDMNSLACWGRASARATRSMRRRMIPGCRCVRSTTPPCSSAT